MKTLIVLLSLLSISSTALADGRVILRCKSNVGDEVQVKRVNLIKTGQTLSFKGVNAADQEFGGSVVEIESAEPASTKYVLQKSDDAQVISLAANLRAKQAVLLYVGGEHPVTSVQFLNCK